VLKLLKLFGVLFSISLRRAVAFRADLLFELVVACAGVLASLAALSVVFTRTDELGGWRPGEAIVLLGTFQIVTGLRSAFVEPNVQWFGEQVKNGRFDAILLQPASSVFLASLGTTAPLALLQVGLGAGLVVFGLVHGAIGITAGGVAAWLLMVVAAAVIMWSTRGVLAAVVFWAFGLSLDVVYDAIWQFARYPVQLYRHTLQVILTYLLPTALIATMPAGALARGAGWTPVAMAAGVALGSLLIAHLVWRAGLRRYRSATS
jgi:ABC-2 type transport system permease protein